jgi:hypothetical protein
VVVRALALVALTAVPALAPRAAGAASAAATRGVTKTKVTVGGLLSADPTDAGADLGARARFARAGRVAGRTIAYTGVASAGDAGAVTQLTTSAFAVVPVVADGSDSAAVLARAAVPFVGIAGEPDWRGNRFGFGITGSGVGPRGREANPAWGAQLRSLLGGARGKTVAIVTDNSSFVVPASGGRGPRPATLVDAGFTVSAPLVVPNPVSPTDVANTAATLMTQNPAVVLVLTTPATVSALAQELAARGYTGTVGAQDALYLPQAPAFGSGLTILTTIAPLESDTAALRRMAADVHAVDANATVTPAVARGYFAADFFVRVLARVGHRLTTQRFLDVANRSSFSYAVTATVGESTWPTMHARAIPCGALVQGDGTGYVVIEPYRCVADVTRTPKR